MENINLFAKLEYSNLSGSVKDRAAYNIVTEAIKKGKINKGTTIVESSSGNFAIALAYICRELELNFIPVVDPNINKSNLDILHIMCDRVCMVEEMDWTGGYLLTRIETVKSICSEIENVFWTNQYENPDNYQAYYNGLGVELCNAVVKPDYVFAAVSSCGTITGISRRMREDLPNAKIIAVDVEGSIIFTDSPQKRHFSGLGASKRSVMLDQAYVDDFFIVSHLEIVQGCTDLLREQRIFGGASSGAVYSAIQSYFRNNEPEMENPNVYMICHDRGYPYLDTVYNKEWVEKNLVHEEELKIS